MAASAINKDYYYIVNAYLNNKLGNIQTERYRAYDFEAATNNNEADDGITTFIDAITDENQAIIIQCGDNVNNASKIEYFSQYGAKRLLAAVRNKAPHSLIYWVGLWYNNSTVYNAISEACSVYNARLIDIRDIKTSQTMNHIGAIYNYETFNTYVKENVSNVNQDDSTHITISFTVDNISYTTTIEVTSWSLNGTTLTFNSKQTYIDSVGVSTHPNDEGFVQIANRIIGAINI